jgi:maleamate amidohydrolase
VKIEGFHGRSGFGRKPALVVIDMSVGFTDPESPLHCDLEEVVDAISRLLEAARAARLPVVYTTVAYDEAAKERAAVFIEKVPALLTLEAGSRWVGIDPRLAPQAGEAVLTKLFASAFYRTPLASLLAAQQVDGVIVTGASTSGCVRATAVDALQHGYRVVVPREAVGDRNPDAH